MGKTTSLVRMRIDRMSVTWSGSWARCQTGVNGNGWFNASDFREENVNHDPSQSMNLLIATEMSDFAINMRTAVLLADANANMRPASTRSQSHASSSPPVTAYVIAR